MKTMRVPDDLHERLREGAFKKRVPIQRYVEWLLRYTMEEKVGEEVEGWWAEQRAREGVRGG